MEFEQPLDNMSMSENNEISDAGARSLLSAGGWARFIGITFYILCGFFAVGALIALYVIASVGGDAAATSAIFLSLCAIFGGLLLVLANNIFRFGTKMRTAINRKDGASSLASFTHLRIYLRLSAILLIVSILGSLLLKMLQSSGRG